MGFQFEHKEYREKIAKELKQAKNAGGIQEEEQILSESQKTKEYQIEYDRKMEQKNYDVVDISSEIPNEIKLYLDEMRLKPKEDTRIDAFGEHYPEFGESRYYEFLNKITNGKYKDIRNPKTSVGAWGGPTARSALLTMEERSEFDPLLTPLKDHAGLWLTFGESYWDDPSRLLAIFSLNNPNFRKYLVFNFLHGSFNFETKFLDKIYKQDINTYEELIKCLPPHVLKEVDKIMIEENIKQKGEDGKIFCDLSANFSYGDQELVLPLLILQNLPIKENSRGIGNGILLRRYDNDTVNELSKKEKRYIHPFLNEDLSFADLADTIVDLPHGRVYKYKLK